MVATAPLDYRSQVKWPTQNVGSLPLSKKLNSFLLKYRISLKSPFAQSPDSDSAFPFLLDSGSPSVPSGGPYFKKAESSMSFTSFYGFHLKFCFQSESELVICHWNFSWANWKLLNSTLLSAFLKYHSDCVSQLKNRESKVFMGSTCQKPNNPKFSAIPHLQSAWHSDLQLLQGDIIATSLQFHISVQLPLRWSPHSQTHLNRQDPCGEFAHLETTIKAKRKFCF